jgi:subtilisin-like proprotein convertase family protein
MSTETYDGHLTYWPISVLSCLSTRRRWRTCIARILVGMILLKLSLGALCSITVLAADPIDLDPLATWFSDDDDLTWSVAWGDMDGDGDLDLAAGNDLGPNKVYLNEHGALQSTTAWDSGDSDRTFSIAWGDVDGDGDLDLAAGNWGGPNKVYLNDGGTLQTTVAWTDHITDSTRSIAWGDMNGDGLLDLAVGNSGTGELNKVYLNEGGTLQPAPVWTGDVSYSTFSVAWGDVDGDGDLDLAVGNSGDENLVYLNLGTILEGSPSWTSGDGGEAARSVAWGDVDEDGDLDLAVGNVGSGESSKIYLNDGTGLGSTTQSFGTDDGAFHMAWGDVDGDGDLDLATTNWTRERVYLNENGALAGAEIWISGDEGTGQSVAWGDVDGDGDLDLAAGNYDSPNRVYLNQGRNLATIAAWSSDDDDSTFSVAWGDMDGDGDLDLAAGNYYSQQNKVYLNDAGILHVTPVWTATVSDRTFSVAWGDMNGDGRLDLAVGNWGEPNLVYLNQGGALETTATWESDDSDNTNSVVWGDVDGDGDLDLAAGNSGQNTLYLNQDGMLQKTATWESDDSDGTYGLAWGDVDRDGDLDLAAGNSGPNKIYRNQGGMLEKVAFWTSADNDSSDGIAWGDVDGDGDLDLATGNWRGLNRVYLNKDGILETTASWTSGDSDYTYDVAWGDMDGDGDLDLAAGNLSGPTKVYINRGGSLGTAAEAPWVPDDRTGTYSVAWGDLNGDGYVDLATGTSSAPNKVYVNQRATQPPYPGQSASIALSLSGAPVQTFSQRVTALAPANFYAVPGIRQEGTIPITYTLAHPTGSPMGYVRGYYSLDGGGHWYTATATQTVTTTLSARLPAHYASRNTFPITISDTGSPISSTLVVLGDDAIADVDVWLNIAHTRNEDLDVFIESPEGTSVELFTGVGGTEDGFLSTILDDEAAISITSGSAPFSGRFRPEGDLDQLDGEAANGAWTLRITDSVPAYDGELVSWGINLQTQGADDGTHVYTWDVFDSGLFGQSDNVVFRLEAYPQMVSGIAGTHLYTDGVPGPYQWPFVSATTFPFRVRGTQVRVLSGTIGSAMPAANAIVYCLPADQSVGGSPIADSMGDPFRTDSQGYLQGRGQLDIGDRLFALVPITWTDSYTLYFTSGEPTVTGVRAFTMTTGGVQTLTVSADNPLILFNLDVSVEWDAHNNTAYLDQLQFNLQRASEHVYDFTDGQVALGRVNVFQNGDEWIYSHVVVQANNRLRPFAIQGGIVSTDTVDSQHNTPPTDTILYSPGQVTMGSTWNRYGNPGQSLGEDWSIILAHELGHYLLFHDDTYIGLDPSGFLIPISTCLGSAMGDLYSNPDNTEFIANEDYWQANCRDTLAEQTLGRNEWETIQLWYPGLVAPTTVLSGPTTMPFDFTTVAVHDPYTPTDTLLDPTFYIDYHGGGGSSSEARAYLDRDEYVVNLGSPFGGQNRVIAHGARPGDRLCVFDRPRAQFGCETVEIGDDRLAMRLDASWNPIVQIRPVNSTTLTIHFSNTVPIAFPLRARIFPDLGPREATITLTPSNGAYSGTFDLTYPAMSGNVQVWVDEPFTEAQPRREVMVALSIGGNPGMQRGAGGMQRGAGGMQRGAGGMQRGAGGMQRGAGAPIVSPDGQMIFFTKNPIEFITGTLFTIQGMAGLPPLLPGRTLVGQGYNLVASPGVTLPTGSVSIQYLSNDVLVAGANEEDLTFYFWNGADWTTLNTVLDTYFNLASAPSQGEGVYALMASARVPLYAPGWNLFAYPLQTTQPVSDALRSIEGDYATVYGYRAEDSSDPWEVYQVDGPGYLNDLSELEPARGYWISATRAVTIHFSNVMALVAQDSPPASPPDTYYGEIEGSATFTPMVGMEVTAWIGGVLCGRGLTREYGGQIVYVVDVMADDGVANAGCGRLGRRVALTVGGQRMVPTVPWDNSQLNEVRLAPASVVYLPLVLKR